jgi:hypothetical protein
MKLRKELIVPILLVVTLSLSLCSCVMLMVVSDNVEDLENQDKEIMTQLAGNLATPEKTPELSDSIAYYKSERQYIDLGYSSGITVTFHRFYFKRAAYTDSLFNGFSILVAEIGNRSIIIENQDNVNLSASALGVPLHEWKAKLNELSDNREPYADYSDNGLKLRTFIRSNKY